MTLQALGAPTEGKIRIPVRNGISGIPPLRKYVTILNKLRDIRCDVTPRSLVDNKVSEDPIASIFMEELHSY